MVQPPGGGVDPDPAGSFLRRYSLVGGHAELDPDTLGRAHPPQGVQRAVCPVRCAQPHFPQAKLEQQRGDDRHQSERLGRGRTAGRVRPVEEAAGGDQAPHGQPGRQARLGPRCPAHQQHRADSCCTIEREEQQVRPGAAESHIRAGETHQALRGDAGRSGCEPAEQHVLGRGRYRLPCTRVLARHPVSLSAGLMPGTYPAATAPRRSPRSAGAVPGRAAGLIPSRPAAAAGSAACRHRPPPSS